MIRSRLFADQISLTTRELKIQIVHATLEYAAKEARYKRTTYGEITRHILVGDVAHAEARVVVEELVRERVPPERDRVLELFVFGSTGDAFVHFVDAVFGLHVEWYGESRCEEVGLSGWWWWWC